MATLLIAALFILFLSLTLGVSVTVGGTAQGAVSASGSLVVSDNELVLASPTSVPAAQPAVLTTHTTNTTGTLTMTNANHGIVTGQRIDIYWAGGRCYGAVAGTVAGATVPIASVSGGSALPASGTAVTVGIPVQVTFPVTGNNLSALVLSCPQESQFTFASSAPADVLNVYLPAGQGYFWATGSVGANPFTGLTPASVWMSHSYVTAALTTQQAAALTH